MLESGKTVAFVKQAIVPWFAAGFKTSNPKKTHQRVLLDPRGGNEASPDAGCGCWIWGNLGSSSWSDSSRMSWALFAASEFI